MAIAYVPTVVGLRDGAVELDEISRSLAAIPQSPWTVEGKAVVTPDGSKVAYCLTHELAEFVAHAPRKMETMRAAIEGVRALLTALGTTGTLGRDALKATGDVSARLVTSPLLEDAVLPLLLSDEALSVTADLARALSEDDTPGARCAVTA